MCLVLLNLGFHYTDCLDCPYFSKKVQVIWQNNYIAMETAVESLGVIEGNTTIVIALIDLSFFLFWKSQCSIP